MVTLQWILSSALALTAVVCASDFDHNLLLARQAPGTPAYNCHDNCGQSIVESKVNKDVCSDNIFLSDYKACLQCAGPDNQDIWKDYGPALSKVAGACNLATTPVLGVQPTVGTATPAASSGSAPSSSAQSSPTPTSTPTAAANGTVATATLSSPTSKVTSGAVASLANLLGLSTMLAAALLCIAA